MAEHPMMPFWTDAYLSDTSHLTTIEHGAYLLLLITMWRNRGALPNDDKKLARYARLSDAQWARVKPRIIDFFTVNVTEITQSRLTDEYDAVKRYRERQSTKAKARWLKHKKTGDSSASPGIDPAIASPFPSPIKKDSSRKKDRTGRPPVAATADRGAARSHQRLSDIDPVPYGLPPGTVCAGENQSTWPPLLIFNLPDGSRKEVERDWALEGGGS